MALEAWPENAPMGCCRTAFRYRKGKAAVPVRGRPGALASRLRAPPTGDDRPSCASTAVNTSRSQKISNTSKVMVPIQMQSYYSLFPQWRLSTRSFRALTIGLTGRHGAQHLRATCLPSPLVADDTLGKAGDMIKARAVPVPSDSVLAPLYVGT